MWPILISGYSEDFVVIVDFDESCGEFCGNQFKLIDAELSRCSYGFFDRSRSAVFFVHELDDGKLSEWRIDAAAKTIAKVRVAATNGSHPAHLAVNENELLVTNYSDSDTKPGSLVVFDRNTFEVNRDEYYGAGSQVEVTRQIQSHPHGCFFGPGGCFYVVDLGRDSVLKYDKEGRKKAEVKVTPAGCGPRHLAVDEARNRLYIVCELKPMILILTADDSMTRVGEVNLAYPGDRPPVRQYPAGIEMSGDLLYVANRGSGAIFVFKILGGDRLEQVHLEEIEGCTWPRFITVKGQFLFSADQNSDEIYAWKLTSNEKRPFEKMSRLKLEHKGTKPTFLAVLD